MRLALPDASAGGWPSVCLDGKPAAAATEASDLRRDDRLLPGKCVDCGDGLANVLAVRRSRTCAREKIEYKWGRITLSETDPRAGFQWTDDGRTSGAG